MLTNIKKVPPLGRSSKRLQRPYPKADITIDDQQREQKKLLNAGKAFSGYSQRNLDIIAISYEHKCFAEAKNKVPPQSRLSIIRISSTKANLEPLHPAIGGLSRQDT